MEKFEGQRGRSQRGPRSQCNGRGAKSSGEAHRAALPHVDLMVVAAACGIKR